MKKYQTQRMIFFILVIMVSLVFSGCFNRRKIVNDSREYEQNKSSDEMKENGNNYEDEKPTEKDDGDDLQTEDNNRLEQVIDLEKVKPNEAGKIMVVMFHNFVESFTPTRYDAGEYTITFDKFRDLLQTLYDMDYRLISMEDYINNNIYVPAGYIPMVFTFDDGTSGQFNVIEQDGKLIANPRSAVGIMEEFSREYPDFGLKGTFYVNLGLSTFAGKGTVEERLQYLIDKGFEIGNHTLTHADLKQASGVDAIKKDVGGNQKRMYQLIPGYMMETLALPFGNYAKLDLQEYVIKGEYDGVEYENRAIMKVGWDPAHSPVHKNFDALNTPRVRSPGINPVDTDLSWWLKRLSRAEQYVSDGNADTITVPESQQNNIDNGKIGRKQLIIY